MAWYATGRVVAKIIIAVAVIRADALLIGPAAEHALVSGHSSGVLSGATIGHAVAVAPPHRQWASRAAAPHGRAAHPVPPPNRAGR